MKILIIIILYFCILSCGETPQTSEAVSAPVMPHYKLVVGDGNEIADISDIVKNVRKIEISAEVAEKVGVIFHFYVVDDKDVILVDEISGNITRLNSFGDVEWQINARSDDYRYHNIVSECTFDPFNRLIVVYDEDKKYIYNFSGEQVAIKNTPNFNFHQLFYISGKDVVYSAQAMANPYVSSVPKQVIWEESDSLKGSFIDDVYQSPTSVYISGFDEFSRFKDQVYYHPTFRDTFYQVDLPFVNKSFAFSFSGRETTDDLMRNGNVKNKLKYVVDRELLYINAYGVNDFKFAISYQRRNQNFMGILDRTSEDWVLNNQHLRFRDLTFGAPFLYQDGRFLRMFPQYQVEHYAKLPGDATSVSRE